MAVDPLEGVARHSEGGGGADRAVHRLPQALPRRLHGFALRIGVGKGGFGLQQVHPTLISAGFP